MQTSGKCAHCPVCDILSGWGGACAFSDGKLNLSPDIGGFLTKYISRDTLIKLIDYVDKIYVKYGAPEKLYEPAPEIVKKIKSVATKNGISFYSILK